MLQHAFGPPLYSKEFVTSIRQCLQYQVLHMKTLSVRVFICTKHPYRYTLVDITSYYSHVTLLTIKATSYRGAQQPDQLKLTLSVLQSTVWNCHHGIGGVGGGPVGGAVLHSGLPTCSVTLISVCTESSCVNAVLSHTSLLHCTDCICVYVLYISYIQYMSMNTWWSNRVSCSIFNISQKYGYVLARI